MALEDRLVRLLERYADPDGWQLVHFNGLNSVGVKVLSATCMLVRTCAILEVPLHRIVSTIHPESVCSLRGEYYRELAEAVVVKSYGFGNILAWMRYGLRGVLAKQAVLHSSCLEFEPDGSAFVGCHFRMYQLRDFPEPGGAGVVAAPVDLDRFELRETLGMYRASATFVAPELGGAMTRLCRVCPVHTRLRWSVPLLIGRPAFAPTAEVLRAHVERADEQAYSSKAGSLVVRLRKCSGGPPLVPSVMPVPGSHQEITWEPAATGEREFQLADYLQRLLRIARVEGPEVFNSLDGHQVVFYEAVVRRADWPRIWQALDPILLAHRTAYRQRFGGSGAPHLDVDVAPRFCNRSRASGDKPSSGSAQEPEIAEVDPPEEWPWQAQSLTVKNTFLHFSQEEACRAETMSEP